MPTRERLHMSCQQLTDACLTLHAPTPGCSSLCPVGKRPFHVDVYGPDAQAEVAAAVSMHRFLPDPVDGFRFRHLEKDLFANNDSHKHLRRRAHAEDALTMLWPNWEGGFGDHYMWTIIPLGYLLSQGELPNGTLAISGALYSKLYEPLRLTRPVCMFERNDSYHDVRIVNPLPRCSSACYSRISVCSVPRLDLRTTHAWRGIIALDQLMGFPAPLLDEAATSTVPGVLHVLFARRKSWHGRSLLNLEAVIESCSSANLTGWRLRCNSRTLGDLPLVEMVRLMRRTDVFVSMHGADVINGMHMLPGRALLEVVNNGFERAADVPPYWFLSCFQKHFSPTFVHKRLILLSPQPGIKPNYIQAWNRDSDLPLELFHRGLQSIVSKDGNGVLEALDLRTPEAPPPGQGIGYCARTQPGGGDCAHGDMGSWAVTASKLKTMAACVAACRECNRCNFVSFSQDHRDCSWFWRCNLNKLGSEYDGHKFLTKQVRNHSSRGAGGDEERAAHSKAKGGRRDSGRRLSEQGGLQQSSYVSVRVR